LDSTAVDAVARELQLTSDKVTQRETRFKQWNFFGKEREKHLSLASPFVFVSYKQYTTFDNMNAEFAAVVSALDTAFPDARVSRFGLRYINSIEIPDLANPTAWNEYISADLIRTLSFFSDTDRLTRLIQVAELKYEDLNVRFQFGMPNPDYPAPMKRPQFVLDLDAYVQTAHDLRESLQYMDHAHQRIQDLFERSITDKLRERMNARPAAPVQQ
jgi:uncharacterized protein (TIGR04255 family)